MAALAARPKAAASSPTLRPRSPPARSRTIKRSRAGPETAPIAPGRATPGELAAQAETAGTELSQGPEAPAQTAEPEVPRAEPASLMRAALLTLQIRRLPQTQTPPERQVRPPAAEAVRPEALEELALRA